MGIEPIGAVAALPHLVESRTWMPPAVGTTPDAIEDVVDAAVAAAKAGAVQQPQ